MWAPLPLVLVFLGIRADQELPVYPENERRGKKFLQVHERPLQQKIAAFKKKERREGGKLIRHTSKNTQRSQSIQQSQIFWTFSTVRIKSNFHTAVSCCADFTQLTVWLSASLITELNFMCKICSILRFLFLGQCPEILHNVSDSYVKYDILCTDVFSCHKIIQLICAAARTTLIYAHAPAEQWASSVLDCRHAACENDSALISRVIQTHSWVYIYNATSTVCAEQVHLHRF